MPTLTRPSQLLTDEPGTHQVTPELHEKLVHLFDLRLQISANARRELSDKDRRLLALAASNGPFAYDGIR